MELVRSKVLIVFVVLFLGVICISSINNNRIDHHKVISTVKRG